MSHSVPRRTLTAALALAAWTLAPPPAALADAGESPAIEIDRSRGRIRVQVGRCTLEAPPEREVQLRQLAVRAREILPRLENNLGVRFKGPFRIILIPPDTRDDPEMVALDTTAPSWAAAFLFPGRRIGGIRIACSDRYPYSDLASVLAHEAVHMLLHDAAGNNLPRWFSEGVATGEERAWGLRDILVYTSSLLTGRLPSLDEMNRAFEASPTRARAAYAASFDFVSWVRRRHGEESIRDLLREAGRRPFHQAWSKVIGRSLHASEKRWRRGSLILYRWIPALTSTTTLWIGITLLTFLAMARRRARSQAILERWKAEADDWE